MARLIAALIRHGDYHQLADTPSAHQPFPLTAKGKNQAQTEAIGLRDMLHQHNWNLVENIDSSRLLRAWETARIFARELSPESTDHIPVTEFEQLAERGLGSAANLTTRQIEEIIEADPRFESLSPDWKSASHFRLPLQGAESLMQAGERVARHIMERMQGLEQSTANLQNEQTRVKLFIGHGAAFRHAAHHLGVLSFEDIARLSMYHAHPVLIERNSDGSWSHIGGHWKVRKGNDNVVD